MNSWWFRTKPRSVLKTFEWFPYFAELEGENWNYKLDNRASNWNNKPIHPIRREYIYRAHWDELEDIYFSYENYMSGKYDINETESTGRNDKTTYEFYGLGFVDKKGKVRVTKAGKIVKEGKMDENLLLKQLLKIQFPSQAIHKTNDGGVYVFPLEVILNVYKHFDNLNRFELGFLFMCNRIENLHITIQAISEYREKYSRLSNKQDINNAKNIFTSIMRGKFPNIKNKPDTYFSDYSDALIRTLEYTGLFSQKGIGYYTKLFIPEHAKLKVRLLQEQYKFEYNQEEDFEKYMEWFGDPYNIPLPWEVKENIKIIIDNKIDILKNRLIDAERNIIAFEVNEKLKEIQQLKSYKDEKENVALIELDKNLSENIIRINEELFIKYYSKTNQGRAEIVEKFYDIIEGNEDMAALWLECNTWKSLVAIKGEHYVKRNFKVEEDLTPKAFAPGIGNTPDMELYKNGYILIPEVSLMTGVKQWEHEGSSVVDHVYKFIEQNNNKKVMGLFISTVMNIRTVWQFFILNRESWIGKPVPVIPITIKQYIGIIECIYDNDLTIDDFKELIECIHKATFKYNTFKEWQSNIDCMIKQWKELKVS